MSLIRLLILFLLVFILIIAFLPVFIYSKKIDNIEIGCTVNNEHTLINKGDTFVIVKDILEETCRKKIVDMFLEEARKNKKLNEDRRLTLYSNRVFLDSLSKIIGQKLFPVNSLDQQRCWLRYYYEDMKSQYYENYHYDLNRYDSTMRQYRLVIPVYNTSDAEFTIEGYGTIPFKQNVGVFIEAGKCLHKVKFTKGERLILIMDFTTKDCDSLESHYTCRGVGGYLNWMKDVIWRYLSSIHYSISN
jgi:hypothetical protein